MPPSQHIDLIILDLMTPATNESDAMETIQQQHLTRGIPVLITSFVESSANGILPGA